jgi:hypothetical protein
MKSMQSMLAVGALALLLPLSAMASTAANTVISNTATVSYQDTGGVAQTPVTSAAATVTVSLVASAPLLSSPAGSTVAQNQTVVLTYTITSTANGPDSYTLTDPITPSNLSAQTGAISGTNPIPLGGTTLALNAVAGATSITVPWDSVAGGAVNGINTGATIVIGGNVYTVASVDKSASSLSNNVAIINLSSPITGATVNAGSVVGQQATFTVTLNSGTLQGAATSGTQTVTTTATSVAKNTVSTTQATPTVITVQKPSLTVTKLVSTDNGATFND